MFPRWQLSAFSMLLPSPQCLALQFTISSGSTTQAEGPRRVCSWTSSLAPRASDNTKAEGNQGKIWNGQNNNVNEAKYGKIIRCPEGFSGPGCTILCAAHWYTNTAEQDISCKYITLNHFQQDLAKLPPTHCESKSKFKSLRLNLSSTDHDLQTTFQRPTLSIERLWRWGLGCLQTQD